MKNCHSWAFLVNLHLRDAHEYHRYRWFREARGSIIACANAMVNWTAFFIFLIFRIFGKYFFVSEILEISWIVISCSRSLSMSKAENWYPKIIFSRKKYFSRKRRKIIIPAQNQRQSPKTQPVASKTLQWCFGQDFMDFRSARLRLTSFSGISSFYFRGDCKYRLVVFKGRIQPEP